MILIGDVCNNDQRSVLVLDVVLVPHETGETDWVTVNSCLSESSEDGLIESGIGSSGEELEKLSIS